MKNKIELRKFKMSDLESIMEMFPHKEITDAIGLTLSTNPPKITKQFEKKWVEKVIKDYKRKTPENYILAVIQDGIHIGSIGTHKIDYENESADIGYWIGKEYWGNGAATKATKLFLREINKKFKLKRITAYAYTFNPASKRVLEKCGFKLEGIGEKVKKGKTKFYDQYNMAKIQ